MKAKRYLEDIQRMKARICSLGIQHRSLSDALVNVSPTLSHMPRPATPDVHRMDGLIAAKLDIENKIKDVSARLVEIHNAINSVDDPYQQSILALRYIDGKTWQEITEETYLGRSRVFAYHNLALETIELYLRKNGTILD